MNTYSHAEARDVATKAALEAGRLIRSHAGRLQADAIREKHVHDLVTEIDEASQHLIVDILKSWNPNADFLAEEGELSQLGKTYEGYRWIIDPVDGTTNFTHGFPPYAVSIGLEHDGELVVGVVLEVGRWELFTAVKGEGLQVNGVQHTVSTQQTMNESLLVTGFPYKVFSHIDEYLDMLAGIMKEARGVRRTGSAASDLAYVACGRLDGFFENGLSPWDLAAGVLLVTEAGGVMTNYNGEPNRIYDGQVVATNGLIHQELLEHVASMKSIVV